MPVITIVALVVVVLAALYLISLGIASLFIPTRASRFLLGFASSPIVHYSELLLRIVAGAALVQFAPNMLFSVVFQLFGWMLLITSGCLLMLPWKWHRRFAQQAVPRVSHYIHLIGAASISFGGLILFAVTRGATA